jgi:hypothetical protein
MTVCRFAVYLQPVPILPLQCAAQQGPADTTHCCGTAGGGGADLLLKELRRAVTEHESEGSSEWASERY